MEKPIYSNLDSSLKLGLSTRPLLSFAIPTYNFGQFITATVESIIHGAHILSELEYEIVILDGGSKDDTPTILADLSKKHANIRYQINPLRGGIDRDLNEVAEISKGSYIWLFSADDLLVNGWDREIVPALAGRPDICLVPAELCDLQMKHLRYNPIFKTTNEDAVEFRFDTNAHLITQYLESANTLEALFSFMSAVIVKKEILSSHKAREDYFGTCWAHCARLMPFLFGKGTIIYLNKFLIRKRGGNDSFMENGFVSRIGIAVDGWTRIIHEFFSEPIHSKLLFDALRKDMPLLLFIYAKLTAQNKLDVSRLNTMARSLYSQQAIGFMDSLRYFIYLIIPGATNINKVLLPYLPTLIRLRHQIKSIFN